MASDDIVARLRRNPLYIPTSRINSFGRPQMGFELTSFNLVAADEIERLRAERDEARRLYCEELAFTIELERGEAGNPLDLAAEKGWGGLYPKEESDE